MCQCHAFCQERVWKHGPLTVQCQFFWGTPHRHKVTITKLQNLSSSHPKPLCSYGIIVDNETLNYCGYKAHPSLKPRAMERGIHEYIISFELCAVLIYMQVHHNMVNTLVPASWNFEFRAVLTLASLAAWIPRAMWQLRKPSCNLIWWFAKPQIRILLLPFLAFALFHVMCLINKAPSLSY